MPVVHKSQDTTVIEFELAVVVTNENKGELEVKLRELC